MNANPLHDSLPLLWLVGWSAVWTDTTNTDGMPYRFT